MSASRMMTYSAVGLAFSSLRARLRMVSAHAAFGCRSRIRHRHAAGLAGGGKARQWMIDAGLLYGE